jgi:hypothetical protein
MATNAARGATITFSGDVTGTEIVNAAANAASPGQIQILNLAAGANTITPPGGGATIVAVRIIPPAGNTQLITLKGVTGDTGVPLHKTDYTELGLDATLTTFVLTAAGIVTGLRLIWT